MKKNYFLFGTILAVLAVLLLGIAPVMAAEKTEFPCTETFIDTLDIGTWAYPGGNIHIRGMVQFFREESPDPRNIGYNTVVVNANWRPDGTGPMWGTFHLVTDEDGLWEGTWAGMITEQGPRYHAVGNGFGLYSGMKIWVDVNYGDCQVQFRE
jgi:hypothetical protein